MPPCDVKAGTLRIFRRKRRFSVFFSPEREWNGWGISGGFTALLPQGDFMPVISKEAAEAWWEAVQKHATTIRIDALCDMCTALGLRLVAQAIETGTAETEGLGPQDESAVPKGDAQ